MADNDQFRILVGGTATIAGYAEIATADDGTEPIYVRQYTGVFSSLTRTATLLDGSGNTSFPGTVSATFSGNLTGTASFTTFATNAMSASIAANAVTASRALNANTASFATSAASATSASYATFAATASSANGFTVRETLIANGAFRQFAGAGYYADFAYNGTTYNLGSSETTDNIDFKIAGGGTFTTGGNFRFWTQAGNSTPLERMRITSGGNVLIGASAAFNGERLRVAGSTSASTPAMAITSANPNVSCPNGTATTVYTFPSYPRVMFYMVFVRFDTGTDANGYAAYAIVAASSVASKLMTVVNGSAVTLTLSGLNVQINQTSGATQNAVVSVIQIFANGGSD
jgi:hypothetical protein